MCHTDGAVQSLSTSHLSTNVSRITSPPPTQEILDIYPMASKTKEHNDRQNVNMHQELGQ